MFKRLIIYKNGIIIGKVKIIEGGVSNGCTSFKRNDNW